MRATALRAAVIAAATVAVTLLPGTGHLLAQSQASALLPGTTGTSWSYAAVQTDSADNSIEFTIQESLEGLAGGANGHLFTIARDPGSTYQLRADGDTLFTDIRSTIGGILPQDIDVNELEFADPWAGFVRTDVPEGGEWTVRELALTLPLPEDLKSAFPAFTQPDDTMDLVVRISGIRKPDSTRTLDFIVADVKVFVTRIDLTAEIGYLLFGTRQTLVLQLISGYDIRNEYADGLGLVYRRSDAYDVRASNSLIDQYLFTIPGNEAVMKAFSTGPPTAIGDSRHGQVGETFRLLQNYPNPFNPSTNILFTMKAPGRVFVEVYSVNGQLMATLAGGERFGAGTHTLAFDGSNLASGIYLYRLRVLPDNGSEPFTSVRRMTLLK